MYLIKMLLIRAIFQYKYTRNKYILFWINKMRFLRAFYSYNLVTLISVPFQWRFFTIFCRRGVTNCQRVHLPSTTTTTSSSTTTTKEVFQHQLQKWSPERRTDPTVAAVRRRAVIHGKKMFWETTGKDLTEFFFSY